MTGELTARDLLASGACTGQCLTGGPDTARSCTCICGGTYHGALADAAVEAVAEAAHGAARWWELCERGGWSRRLRDFHTEVIGPTTAAFNKEYRAQNETLGYFLTTIRRSRFNYEVQWDLPSHDSTLWRNEFAMEASRRFCLHLLATKRVRSITTAARGMRSEWGQLCGFSNEDEARTAQVLIGEAAAGGNPCGTVRALYVLHGLTDPVVEGWDPETVPLPPELPNGGKLIVSSA